jgi:hypothetical protein
MGDPAAPTVPVSATFVDNVGGEHPNTPIVKIGELYVIGFKQGGWWKMVAMNATGTAVESRYMSSSKLLNQANWDEANTQTLGYYNFKNVVMGPAESTPADAPAAPTVPVSATFIDNEGGEHPNTPIVKVGELYVVGVKQGGWYKLVAMNAQGIDIEVNSKYMA